MAALYERRTGPPQGRPRPSASPRYPLGPRRCPASSQRRHPQEPLRPHQPTPRPLPASDDDIAFAPVTQLSRWIEPRKLTSERLTNIYLDRLERFDPKLRCVITLTRDHALAQAKQADSEIAAGHYRGPLHGIPWGAKDLLDTAGIPTTYGAEPFRNRVPTADAAVVETPATTPAPCSSPSSASARSRSTTSGSAARP